MAHDRHVLWDAKAVALEHVDATTGELVVAADDGIEGHVTRQPDLFRVSLVAQLVQSNDHIFALSGTMVNTVFSGGKIGWIEREQLEVARAATRYVTIPELLIHEMCGVWATDETYASRSNATFWRNLTCGPSMRVYYYRKPPRGGMEVRASNPAFRGSRLLRYLVHTSRTSSVRSILSHEPSQRLLAPLVTASP